MVSPGGSSLPLARRAAHVTATAEALELIERLRAKHRSLVFFQLGGRCAGSSPMCLAEGDLPPGPNDVRLGEIGGCAFYVDADQYEHWGRPEFVVDVVPGIEESFSLETPEGVHFISRTCSPTVPQPVAAIRPGRRE
jgi:uncharacterized protein